MQISPLIVYIHAIWNFTTEKYVRHQNVFVQRSLDYFKKNGKGGEVGMRAKIGDVVQIDESLVYKTSTHKYKAIVLWDSFIGQLLLTKVGEYRPNWGTYESIAEVIGHVDLKKAATWQ